MQEVAEQIAEGKKKNRVADNISENVEKVFRRLQIFGSWNPFDVFPMGMANEVFQWQDTNHYDHRRPDQQYNLGLLYLTPPAAAIF